ncbi:MAG: hypothetical protein AB8B93_02500, partial [Pseudomonadales bacterium]
MNDSFRRLLPGFCLLLAAGGTSGCGEVDDSVSSVSAESAEVAAAAQPAAAPDPDDPGAWFVSPQRPANKACNAPGYSPGQPDTYPAMHSHLYPAIKDKQQSLLAQIKALAPQVGDEQVYDRDADVRLRRELNVLNQLVFVAGLDLAHHYLTSMCDYQSALEDECSIMGRMMSSTVTLEDFERDGDAISY